MSFYNFREKDIQYVNVLARSYNSYPQVVPHIGIREPGQCLTLTNWGRGTHLYVGEQPIIDSDNDLSPGQGQAITWTNAGILSTGPLGTNFSEILIEICTFSFKKMHLKMLSGKWRPSCPGLSVLTMIQGRCYRCTGFSYLYHNIFVLNIIYVQMYLCANISLLSKPTIVSMLFLNIWLCMTSHLIPLWLMEAIALWVFRVASIKLSTPAWDEVKWIC